MISEIERKSLTAGNLIITDESGNPKFCTDTIWFVWYFRDTYKILLKSFNTNKNNVLISKRQLAKTPEMQDNQIGIGFLDIIDGRMKILKPEFSEEAEIAN
jgi:hypothetical protein